MLKYGMSMDFSPHLAEEIREAARLEGVDPEEMVSEIVSKELKHRKWISSEEFRQSVRKMQEEINEVVKARLGFGLDDVIVKPADWTAEELRQASAVPKP